MATATLSRGKTSVDLPLVGEGAGEPLVSTDVGKPEAKEQARGVLNPRWGDHWSQQRVYTLAARFTSSDAYDRALDLADLLKSHSDGTELELDVDLPEFDSDVPVAPAPGESPLSLAYEPGGRDWVDARVKLVRVSETGGSGNQTAETPRAVGDGPLELSDGTDTLQFTAGLMVDRKIGRPNSVIRRSSRPFPGHIDKKKAAYDAFDLAAEFVGDTAADDAATLEDMVGQRLGYSSLTLDFNGLYGMGSFDVVPEGSQAARLVRASAEENTVIVPELTLRVVWG